MRKSTLACLSCAAAVQLACISPSFANDITVSAYMNDYRDMFQSTVRNNIGKFCKKENIRFAAVDAETLVNVQEKQVSDGLQNNITPAVESCDPNTAPTKMIPLAKQHDLPIVFFNRPIKKDALKAYDKAWFVGSNVAQAGVLQGELIEEYIRSHPECDKNQDGTINIILLKGPEDHLDARIRTKNFQAYLKKKGIKFELVDTFVADWSFEKAFGDMNIYLREGGYADLEMIVSNNDDMALGALAAIDDYNASLENGDEKLNVPIFGVDAIKDALIAVANGKMAGTVKQDAEQIAKAIFLIASQKVTVPEELADAMGFPIESRYVHVPYYKVSEEQAKKLLKNK